MFSDYSEMGMLYQHHHMKRIELETDWVLFSISPISTNRSVFTLLKQEMVFWTPGTELTRSTQSTINYMQIPREVEKDSTTLCQIIGKQMWMHIQKTLTSSGNA